jgi:hypothetical protein
MTKTKKKLTYDESVKLIQERFPEIRRYKELIETTEVKMFALPNLKPKFVTGSETGTTNLFNKYPVYFKDNEVQTIVNFEIPEQVQLYQWLYDNIDLKGLKLPFPRSSTDCSRVMTALREDFKSYVGQVTGVLKTYRSKANALSVYRDVIMG